MVADRPRLSITAFGCAPTASSSEKFCMLRAPDLQHVGVARDQLDVARVHHLGDDGQPGLGARVGEDLEPVLLHPLERVGRRARLERAAAQEVRARRLDRGRGLVDLLAALDRARAGDDAEAAAADARAADVDEACRRASPRATRASTASTPPPRRRRRGITVNMPGIERPLVARDADGQPRGARDLVGREPERADLVLDRGDVGARRAGLHDDEHWGPSVHAGGPARPSHAARRSARWLAALLAGLLGQLFVGDLLERLERVGARDLASVDEHRRRAVHADRLAFLGLGLDRRLVLLARRGRP